MSLQSGCWLRLQIPESLTSCFQDDSLRWLRASLCALPHRSLHRMANCSHNMVAGFPTASDPKQQGRSCNVFYNLALEVTLFFPHNILSYYFYNIPNVSSVHCGRKPLKSKNTGRHRSLGTVLEAVYHQSVDSFIMLHLLSLSFQPCFNVVGRTVPRSAQLKEARGTLCPSSSQIRKQKTPSSIMVKTNQKFNLFFGLSSPKLDVSYVYFPEYQSCEMFY